MIVRNKQHVAPATIEPHGILGALDVGGRTIAIVRNVGGSYEIVEAIYVDYDSVVVKKELASVSSPYAMKAVLRLLGGPT